MATCGYICPVCEGKGFDDKSNVCDFCSGDNVNELPSDEEWIKSVHEGSCCADRQDEK